MIATVFWVSLFNLRRDRVALLLTFVLPVIFFSIFASVFSTMDSESTRPVNTVVVVDPDAEFASQVADRLADDPALEVLERGAIDPEVARESVRSGRAAAAVILPEDLRPA